MKALLLLAVAALAAPPDRGVQSFEVDRPAEFKVEMENVNGEIRISAWDSARAEFRFEKSPSGGTKIYFKETDEGVKVWVEPRERRSHSGFFSFFKGWDETSVNFDVTLPASMKKLKIETINGAVNIKGIRQVSAESVNGAIHIESDSGDARAETINGTISIQVNGLLKGEIRAEAVNGLIEIDLPADVDCDVDLNTTVGGIKTSFPLEVEGGLLSRNAKGRLGSGGPKVRAETVNGAIKLE